MIQLRNIGKDYAPGVHALRCLDVELGDRGLVLVTGPSGSGKSTLARLLAGWERDFRGELLIDGENTRSWSEARWDAWRRSTALLGEEQFLPELTLRENTELSMMAAGWSRGDARANGGDALGILGVETLADSLPGEVSGEERRLAAIAAAIARQPDVLLADEPTDGMERVSAHSVLSLLAAASRDRLVVIFSRNKKLLDGENVRVIELADGQVQSDPGFGGTGAARGFQAPAGIGFFARVGLGLRNLLEKRSRAAVRLFGVLLPTLFLLLLLASLNGTREYTAELETGTLAAYPLELTGESVPSGDLTALAEWLSGRLAGTDITAQYTYTSELSVYPSDTSAGVRRLELSSGGLWEPLPDGDGLRSAGYELLSGRWPDGYDELVVLLDENKTADGGCLAALGLDGGTDAASYTYADFMRMTYRLVLPVTLYVQGADGSWTYMGDDAGFMAAHVAESPSLKIVGIARPRTENGIARTTGGVGFDSSLFEYITQRTASSEIVCAQLASPERDIITGLPFDQTGVHTADAAAQRTTLKSYIIGLSPIRQADLYYALTDVVLDEGQAQDSLLKLAESYSESELAAVYEKYIVSSVAPASLEDNLAMFGVTQSSTVGRIRLYADEFAGREAITALLHDYTEPVACTDAAEGILASEGKLVSALRALIYPVSALGGALMLCAVILVSALAVRSRQNEARLLRRLGMTRGAVGTILGTESLVLSLLGALVGLLLGMAILTLTGGSFRGLSLSLSWLQGGAAAGIAALTGWLAGRFAAGSITK